MCDLVIDNSSVLIHNNHLGVNPKQAERKKRENCDRRLFLEWKKIVLTEDA
jgi:hypothetical protein